MLGGRGWGAWGSEAPGGWAPDGRSLGRTFGRSDVRTDGRTDGRKFPPVFYRTSSPSGLLPCFNLSMEKMCRAGQRVSLTITGPGPSFRCVLASLYEGVSGRPSDGPFVGQIVRNLFFLNAKNHEKNNGPRRNIDAGYHSR